MSESDLLSGNFCVMPQFIVCTVVYQFNYSSLITKLLSGRANLHLQGIGGYQMEFVCLSNDVFERRTSTGSCPFSFLGDGFAQIFSQIVSIRVKKLSNTNYIASRHITREKSSLPVDVRCSKTSLLKLPIFTFLRTVHIH